MKRKVGTGTKAAKPSKKVDRQIHTRPLVARLQRIREMILGGDCPNCRVMADELEVSVRTILRDIDFLRDREEPIHYDPVKNGYRYAPVEEDGRGYRGLKDLASLASSPPMERGRSSLSEVLPESASMQQVVYHTLDRIERWQKAISAAGGIEETAQLGMLFKSCLIFEYLVGRSVAILCSIPGNRARIDDLGGSVVLSEQIGALEQLSQELTPRIRERMPTFLRARTLLTTEDYHLIIDLCGLREKAIAPNQGAFKLGRKPSLLPHFLLKLKRLCESTFVACVDAIEPRMEQLADGDEPQPA